MRDAHIAAGLVWTVLAFVVKKCNEECVINSISQGLHVLVLYLCKVPCFYVLWILLQCCMLSVVIVWFPADCLLYITVILDCCLLPYNSSYLLEETPNAKFYFFVTLHLLCNGQCSSVDYKPILVPLYLCHSHHTVWMTQGRPNGTCSPLWNDTHTKEYVFLQLFF